VLSWLLVGVGVPLLVLGLRLRTEVTDDAVRIRFRPFYRRVVPLDDIVHVEAVTDRPLVGYGGWGIRLGRGGRLADAVRGDQGVALDLLAGRNLLIGSARADERRDAIEAALLARGVPRRRPPPAAPPAGDQSS